VGVTLFSASELQKAMIREIDWLRLHKGHRVLEREQTVEGRRLHFRYCVQCDHTHLYRMETFS